MKITSVLLSIVIVTITFQISFGQSECNTVTNWKSLMANPLMLKELQLKEAMIKKQIKSTGIQQFGIDEKFIEVPVVFHVVLSATESALVTDALLKGLIDTLNIHFQGRNPDSTTGPWFYPIRGRTKFQFVLAKRTPEGCETTGIVRKNSSLIMSRVGNTDINNYDEIKEQTFGSPKWESFNCKYLNIWVGHFSDNTLGFATPNWFPAQEKHQGVVIDFTTFPGIPPLPNRVHKKTLARTLIHEIGHFFDLRHIWGDDQNLADNCSDDDFIDDTPNQEVSSADICREGIFHDNCSPTPIATGIMYQNYMDGSCDSKRTFFTNEQCARMLWSLINQPNRANLISPNNKALLSPEANYVFNSCTSPEFTTNIFSTIGYGADGAVWAGTPQQGLYKYSFGNWRKWNVAPYTGVTFQDIKTDFEGRIWIAQSGSSGAQAISGGILQFPDSSFDGYTVYNVTNSSLPSRNVRSLFVDSMRYSNGSYLPIVWSANFSQITGGISLSGGIGKGINPTTPVFTTIRTGLASADVSGGTAACYVIGGDEKEIWTATQNSGGLSKILKHNASTNALIGTLDTTNILDGMVNGQFQTRAIFFDKKGKKWLGINGEGILVDSAGKWFKIGTTDFGSIFPASPTFNNNAITGDTAGNIYFGTTNGLIVYMAGHPMDDIFSYQRYTIENGLPSNNIRGLCVDTLRKKLLIATDNGIAFWNPVCNTNGSQVFYSSSAGTLNNAVSWCPGKVPDETTDVIVRHPITITTNTSVKSIKIIAPGSVTVAPGINFNILNK